MLYYNIRDCGFVPFYLRQGLMHPFFDRFRHISPSMLIITPLKQHIGCCIVLPALIKLAGGVALLQAFTRHSHAELILVILTLPLFILAILKGEDLWRRHHAKRHQAAHDPCDHHCTPPKASFKQRYIVNLLIGLAMAYALHALFHHHH